MEKINENFNMRWYVGDICRKLILTTTILDFDDGKLIKYKILSLEFTWEVGKCPSPISTKLAGSKDLPK